MFERNKGNFIDNYKWGMEAKTETTAEMLIRRNWREKIWLQKQASRL